MRPALLFTGTLICIPLLFGACASLSPVPVNPSATASTPAPVVYAPATPANLARITIVSVELGNDERYALAQLPAASAPFGSRVVRIQNADTTQPPPWITRVFVVRESDPGVALRLEFRDHATYGVSHQWLNDHLLFLRVWWGRIVSTDLILEAETGSILLAEDASYLGMILPEAGAKPDS